MAKKGGEALGVSGFTLGIVSLVSLIFTPLLGLIVSIVGFLLSIFQQKRNPTKFGKMGIIINSVGFALNIIWWILLIKYLAPIIQAQIQNSLV